MSSSNELSDEMNNVEECPGRVFVDVCTDKTMAAKVIGYRKAAGAIILKCAGPSVEARYVTGLDPSPIGTTLPLPVQRSWVIVSYMS